MSIRCCGLIGVCVLVVIVGCSSPPKRSDAEIASLSAEQLYSEYIDNASRDFRGAYAERLRLAAIERFQFPSNEAVMVRDGTIWRGMSETQLRLARGLPNRYKHDNTPMGNVKIYDYGTSLELGIVREVWVRDGRVLWWEFAQY